MAEQAKHQRRVIRARTGIGLIEAVRKAEGWTWAEGDSRIGRCNELYEIKADHERDQWVATPRTAIAKADGHS